MATLQKNYRNLRVRKFVAKKVRLFFRDRFRLVWRFRFLALRRIRRLFLGFRAATGLFKRRVSYADVDIVGNKAEEWTKNGQVDLVIVHSKRDGSAYVYLADRKLYEVIESVWGPKPVYPQAYPPPKAVHINFGNEEIPGLMARLTKHLEFTKVDIN